MRFEFATAGRIVFGPGTLRELGPIGRDLGRRALLVSGKGTDRADQAAAVLAAAGVETAGLSCPGEPSSDWALEAVAQARAGGFDFVVGVGGGSAIDAAKAVAALVPNTGPLTDYLEVVGTGRALSFPPLPMIAIPTTAGAGAEVTRNAVLTVASHRQKVSLRSPLMLPRVALVDPELTLGLPPAVTAATGMDALTQLIEPYVSCRANPLTDALCLEGIQRIARSLRRAAAHGNDLAARVDLSLAALFGGLALANAGLGAVHGFAGPVGGEFPAPHGAVCAALLPRVMAANVRALTERAPGSEPLQRYERLARMLTGNPQAGPGDGAQWADDLRAALGIPPLGAYGITAQDVPGLAAKAAGASSMKANPIVLSAAELSGILMEALA